MFSCAQFSQEEPVGPAERGRRHRVDRPGQVQCGPVRRGLQARPGREDRQGAQQQEGERQEDPLRPKPQGEGQAPREVHQVPAGAHQAQGRAVLLGVPLQQALCEGVPLRQPQQQAWLKEEKKKEIIL